LITGVKDGACDRYALLVQCPKLLIIHVGIPVVAVMAAPIQKLGQIDPVLPAVVGNVELYLMPLGIMEKTCLIEKWCIKRSLTGKRHI